MSTLARTPLNACHRALGARMGAFAGWEMPISYPQGTLAEYWAARGDEGAALFDVSHMGQIWIEGSDALAFVQFITSNDAARLVPGKVQYSGLLNEQGGFIDDLTVHRLDENAFFFCVNAANRERVLAHLHAQAARFAVTIEDRSAQTALLALQGLSAERMLSSVVDGELDRLSYYAFTEGRYEKTPIIIARTGYTGEDGFEVYLPAERAQALWQALMAQGAQPAGLACRDLLRIEMGYALYGHEIDEAHTPLEAGLSWIVAFEKGDFIGRSALMAQKERGIERRLVGLCTIERSAPPRAGYAVVREDGTRIGKITSGAFSPKRKQGVALAYLAFEDAALDRLFIEVRARRVAANKERPPFVPPRVRRSSK